jgi:hypothetical protein
VGGEEGFVFEVLSYKERLEVESVYVGDGCGGREVNVLEVHLWIGGDEEVKL